MVDLRTILPRTISVLGTPYRVELRTYDEDPLFKKENYSAYCSSALHLIAIGDHYTFPDAINKEAEQEDMLACRNNECLDLRHEIVHAFLNESGLMSCAGKYDIPWSKNEEMVDWIAIQGPKIFLVFTELGII